jgi:putative heme-binding domain-containing protein
VHPILRPSILCTLLTFAPLAMRAQDHIDPNEKPLAPAAGPGAAKGNGGGRAATANPGMPNPAGPRVGGGFVAPDDAMVAEMNRILATPTELAKGKLSFENHCVGCHGPKGEGSRGPTLAQPNLPRASGDVDLLTIIQRGIVGTEMPAVRLKMGEAPYLAAYVRSLGKIAYEPVPGDAAKGAEHFKTKGACMTCHALNGQGGAIGPDLTDIGLRRSPTFLRRALVDPNADVPQSFNPLRAENGLPMNFVFVRAKTKDGKEVAGIRLNENTYSIQIRDVTGGLYSLDKGDLVELIKDKTSPMPVYAGVFSPAEMDDVIAYLVSLKGKKKA